jgi:single-stranded-DNA-specific exonuclease
MTTRWLDPPHVEIPASFQKLELHPLVAGALLGRGFTDPDSVRAFLHPDELPSTPFPDLKFDSRGGISVAIERVNLAIRERETICVWGDFDVDGQTSTALLVQTLRALGANVVYYIPIRAWESHGLHIDSLKPILDNGASLVITCDTGITAHESVDYARSRSVDVIITDHHDLGETLPNALAVINPKLLPEHHPLAGLAGVGVAYKFAESLLNSETGCAELLDLVALGLIADVALLQGETRSLAQKGIQALRQTKRLGLKVIADPEHAGVNLETLTEETIGFTFAPRLNALGRLGDANPAVELLLTSDPARARVLAAHIEELNKQRRLLTSQVYEAAEKQLEADPKLLAEPAIVLSHPNWPGGVVGIVANKLVERHHKPALLLTESEDGILRGSARSIEGLHITRAIASQKALLLGFGGHPMAAGLSLHKENFDKFCRGLGKAIEAQLGEIVRAEPALQIDAWLGLDEINLGLAEAIEMLAPFGAGNPDLTLATHGVTLKAAREIGKTKEHLRLNIEDGSGNAQSLLWWGGAGEDLPEEGSKFDIAYSLRASTYRGQKQVTLQFEDFRITEEASAELRPRRFEVVDYRLQGGPESLDSGTLIWAEGADRSKGRSRFDLVQSDEFAIYTAPPSPIELHQALDVVKPRKVYVFAVSPSEEKPEEFLNRLAGLCKYTLNQRRGKVALPELAVAMAARARAVELGLRWLAAGGQLTVVVEEDQVTLSAEKTEKNPYLQDELRLALRGILNETSAYRKYFRTAEDLKALL